MTHKDFHSPSSSLEQIATTHNRHSHWLMLCHTYKESADDRAIVLIAWYGNAAYRIVSIIRQRLENSQSIKLGCLSLRIGNPQMSALGLGGSLRKGCGGRRWCVISAA